jgi:hypothetical protein
LAKRSNALVCKTSFPFQGERGGFFHVSQSRGIIYMEKEKFVENNFVDVFFASIFIAEVIVIGIVMHFHLSQL